MKKIALLLLAVIVVPMQADAARVYTTGYEWQSATAGIEFGFADGTPAISTSIKNGGSASLQLAGAVSGAPEGVDMTITSVNTFYFRADVYIDSMPTASNAAFQLYVENGSATSLGAVRFIDSGGSLDFQVGTDYGNYGNITDTASVSYDRWHRVEMYVNAADAAGQDDITVRIDGVQVANSNSLTLATGGISFTALTDQTSATDTFVAYIDNVAINDTTGSYQNSWPGAGKVVMAVPNAAGASACTVGTFSSVNEVPPSDSSTGSTDRCELQTNSTVGLFNVTDSSTLGISPLATINLVQVMARVREATSGATNWFPRLNSNGSGATSGSSVDAGDTTARTNPNSTTAFGNTLISYVNPVTLAAWTPTGTDSIDSLQIGAGTSDGNPDTYILTLGAMVEYVEPAPPTGPLYYSVGKLILTGGKMTII